MRSSIIAKRCFGTVAFACKKYKLAVVGAVPWWFARYVAAFYTCLIDNSMIHIANVVSLTLSKMLGKGRVAVIDPADYRYVSCLNASANIPNQTHFSFFILVSTL